MSRGIPSALAAVGLAAVLVLAGCTSTPTPSPTTPTPSPTTKTADDVGQEIRDTTFPSGSLGQTSGTIDSVDKVRVTIDVVELDAAADSTMLELRIATASGKQAEISSFQLAVQPFLDTRNIGVVDTGSGKTYRPFTYQNARDTGGQNTGCLCGDVSGDTDGTGVLVSMILPPMPGTVSQVDVLIPGMKKMTGVPVSRE